METVQLQIACKINKHCLAYTTYMIYLPIHYLFTYHQCFAYLDLQAGSQTLLLVVDRHQTATQNNFTINTQHSTHP